MEKETIINEAVQTAYKNITSIVDLRLLIVGDYFSLMIPESILKNNMEYADEIINNVFWKLCDELSKKVTKDDMEFIMYKSFVNNDPSENLIKDCFNIVNDILSNKKSSNNTTIFSILDVLKDKYNKEEVSKSLNTIFDILLDYYSIIKK